MNRASSPTPEEELDWIIAADTAEMIHGTKKGIWINPREKDKKKWTKYAFENPLHPGYGGGPWPFDWERALLDRRYRQGLYNAIASKPVWTAKNWRDATKDLLVTVRQSLFDSERLPIEKQMKD